MVPGGISARSILQTVFGNDADDLSNAPRDTSLQRAILEACVCGQADRSACRQMLSVPRRSGLGTTGLPDVEVSPGIWSAVDRIYAALPHCDAFSPLAEERKRKEVDMERFGKLELDYLAEVIASGSLNSKTGKFTTRLEERFAAWVGAEYARGNE